MKRVPLYIIEGAWDKPHEAPQLLPFFEAYANTFRDIDLNHRTFRSAEDIKYYVSRLPKNSRAFLYVACHGEVGSLIPADGRSKISNDQVKLALSAHKPNSIGFVHFGCCSFVKAEAAARRRSLESLQKASGAHWVSGYTRDVDWLPSTLLDVALVSEIYVPWRESPTKRQAHLKRLKSFEDSYAQLARSLGFSAISSVQDKNQLFPRRVSQK